MKLSTVQKAIGAIVIANIIWGAAPAIFKISLQNVPTFTLAFWRFFIGAILLLVILRKKVILPKMSQRDFFLLICYAVTGITINIMFFFWGLKLTYSINAPVISAAQPILTFFLAIAWLHEQFNLRKLFGMILGSIGIIVIVLSPLLHIGMKGSLMGNIFLVIATVAAVVQTIIGKDVLARFDPIAFTFWTFIVGAASFVPMAVQEAMVNPHLYQMLDIRGYIGIGYGAVFSSAIAYALFAWGLVRITATDASIYSYIDPVIGTILSYFLLKEPITSYFVAGSGLIFGGIFLAEGKVHHYHLLHHFQPAPAPQVIASPLPIRPKVDKKEVLSHIFKRDPETPARQS